MPLQDRLQERDLLWILHRLDADELGVVAPLQFLPLVQDIGHASGHPRPEVVPHRAQDHHAAAGHILTAVIPHAFHDGPRPAVAHREAIAGPPGDEEPPAGGPIQGGVADQHRGRIPQVMGRADDELPTPQPFAYAVVGGPDQDQPHAPMGEGPEALASLPDEQ